MKIYRTIFVKNTKDINTDAIGNHWSVSDLVFVKYSPFTESNKLRGENEEDYTQIFIEAEISNNDINEDNDELANSSTRNEAEIITKFNHSINIIVYDEDDILFEGIANTGDNYQEISY